MKIPSFKEDGFQATIEWAEQTHRRLKEGEYVSEEEKDALHFIDYKLDKWRNGGGE